MKLKQILLEVYKLMNWVLALIFIWGFILPYLISYPNDMFVLLGAFILVLATPYLGLEIYKVIKEIVIIKNDLKNL